MFKIFGLVLLSALAALGADRVNINRTIDILTNELNTRVRQQGTATARIPEIPLGPKVKYSEALLLGVDSTIRTGDCWLEKKGDDYTVDIHYGFQMLTVVLPHLDIEGTNMSAYARIRDNSVHVSYTLHHPGDKCFVTLNEMRVEKMENVEFGASRPEYDNSNWDGFFKSVVTPTLNQIVDSNIAKIEAGLQVMCTVKALPNEPIISFILLFQVGPYYV